MSLGFACLYRDIDCIGDLPVDVLEVALRLAGIAVDIEDDIECTGHGPLVTGIDFAPLPDAAVRERGREATLLVLDVASPEARDEETGLSRTCLGEADSMR